MKDIFSLDVTLKSVFSCQVAFLKCEFLWMWKASLLSILTPKIFVQ